jgi:signal transduction histidine kinase
MVPRAASSPILPDAWRKGEIKTVLLIVTVASAWALLIGLRQPRAISGALITANAIGLSQWTVSMIVRLFLRGRLPPWGVALHIPAGIILGSKLAALAGVPDFTQVAIRDPGILAQSILLGVVVTAFFLHFSHSQGVKVELERQRRRAAEALHAETASRLALLQAQIEPHFLFNTLANIHSLIGEDPDKASLMLEELNAYLRASLRRTRQPTSTLGEELELVKILLEIAGARLGRRLKYTIEVPAELRSHPLPPLLLQPLVENAIRHGVEPAVAGGQIRVQARQADGALELTVADTGVGLHEDTPEGVGLANVRDRLRSLYSGSGRLALYTNVPCGVIAKVLIPAAGTSLS